MKNLIFENQLTDSIFKKGLLTIGKKSGDRDRILKLIDEIKGNKTTTEKGGGYTITVHFNGSDYQGKILPLDGDRIQLSYLIDLQSEFKHIPRCKIKCAGTID